jgi:hypothetical protein
LDGSVALHEVTRVVEQDEGRTADQIQQLLGDVAVEGGLPVRPRPGCRERVNLLSAEV